MFCSPLPICRRGNIAVCTVPRRTFALTLFPTGQAETEAETQTEAEAATEAVIATKAGWGNPIFYYN